MARLLQRLLQVLHLSARSLIWLALLAMLLFALVAGSFRFYVLPRIDQYRLPLVARLSEQLGRPVTVAAVRGVWRGAHITVEIRDIAVLDLHGAPSLQVRRAVGELSWWSLLRRELLFRDLQLSDVLLRLGRDRGGQLWLGDLPLPTDGRGSGPDWLLRQDRVLVQQGQLLWQDASNPGQRLQMNEITAAYEGGFFVNEASLALRPATGGALWRATAQWQGDSFKTMKRWRGTVRLDLPPARLEALLPWFSPAARGLTGEAQGHVQLEFSNGSLSAGRGKLRGQAVQILHPAMPHPLQVQTLNAAFVLRPWHKTGVAVQFDDLRLLLPAPAGRPPQEQPLSLAGLRVAVVQGQPGAAGGQLSLPQLDLMHLRPILQGLPALGAIDINALAPAGLVQQLTVGWHGDWRSPQQLSASARLQEGAWQAFGSWPGMSGVNARLVIKDGSGSLAFGRAAGQALTLIVPQVFDQPLIWNRFDGTLHWQRVGKEFKFTLPGLSLANGDIGGVLKGSYQTQAQDAGTVVLDGDFGPARAAAVGPYLPRVLNQATRGWLRQAFTAGTVSHTTFNLHGKLSDFPFDGKPGLFRVYSALQGVRLHYGAGWPTVDAINGSMLFQGRGMRIEARSADILGTRVTAASASIALLDVAEPLLQIEGKVAGPTRNFLDFVMQSPLQQRLGGFVGALDVSGNGSLELGIDLPLQNVDATRVRGRYQFNDNALLPRGFIPRVDDVNGVLDFTESSVSLPLARGRALGGDVKVSARTRKDGVTEVDIAGRADMRQVVQVYDLPMGEHVSGSSDYKVQLSEEAEGMSLQLHTELEGVAVNLPAPYGKSAAQSASLKVGLQGAVRGRQHWSIALRQQLGARLVFAPASVGGLQLERGQVNLGSAQIPAAVSEGLWLSGRAGTIRPAEWMGLFDGGSAGADNGLRGVNLTLDGVEWQGQRWPELALEMRRDGKRWSGTVQSPLARGSIQVDGSGRGSIKARFDTLGWNALLPGAASRETDTGPGSALSGALGNAANWPALELSVEHLKRNGRDLGRLSVTGTPLVSGYRLSDVQLDNNDGQVRLQSEWLREAGAWRGRLHFDLTGKDMGQWLSRWGHADLLLQGDGSISADLDWLNASVLPSVADVGGDIAVQGRRGTLLKVNPGVGRLLGLLNIESVLRRVRLDFKDVLSQGLAFDTVQGSARLNRATLTIASLHLVGPALDMTVSGDANLRSEALKLNLKVVPSVSGGVAVAGAMLNPVVGLSLLVLQQVLSNPVGKMLTYTYTIGGTWSKPEVRSSSGKLLDSTAEP